MRLPTSTSPSCSSCGSVSDGGGRLACSATENRDSALSTANSSSKSARESGQKRSVTWVWEPEV